MTDTPPPPPTSEDAPTQEAPKEQAPAEQQTERDEGKPNGKPPRLTDEQFKALPQEAQARIGYLSSELRDAKRAAAQYEQSHEQLQAIKDFAERNRLSAEDVTTGLDTMALFTRGDFRGFLDAIMPHIEIARQALGEGVHPELQKLVDSGDLTADAAMKLSRDRTQGAIREQNAQRDAEVAKQQREADAKTKLVSDMQAAVKRTEADIRAKDPDYALKETAVRQQFQLLLSRGAFPRSVAEVEKMVRDIHSGVQIIRPQPQLRETQQRPASTESPRRAAPARTSLEAVQNAILGITG